MVIPSSQVKVMQLPRALFFFQVWETSVFIFLAYILLQQVTATRAGVEIRIWKLCIIILL